MGGWWRGRAIRSREHARPGCSNSRSGRASRTSAAAAGSISEEVAKWVAQGNKWSKSTIAAEQARRGRKGLPPLNNAEMSALLGEPVEASAPLAAAAAPTPASVAPAAKAASGPISAEVAKWVAEGKKWSKSTIAAEQARRGRKSLPALTDAEVAALLGEPAAAEAPAAAAVAAPVARPAAAAPPPHRRSTLGCSHRCVVAEVQHLRRHTRRRNIESSGVGGRGLGRTGR